MLFRSLKKVQENVRSRGKLFIAIYNDQGSTSKIWWKIKKTYVSLPGYLRWMVLIPCYIRLWGITFVKDILRLRPFDTWMTYKKSRGMSAHRDVIDWAGGFPFEVSKPEKIFSFYKSSGFTLCVLKTFGGLGCNEYVFERKG